MLKTRRFANALPITALACMLCAMPASGAVEVDDNWQTTLRIYGWLPKIGGTVVGRDGQGNTVLMNQAQILDLFQFAFMGSAEVRKGRWSVITDLIYLNLQGDSSHGIDLSPSYGSGFRADVDAKLTGWVWTLGGGYTLWRNERGHLDGVLGVRYFQLKSENDLTLIGPRGRATQRDVDITIDSWDPIIGVRGRFAIDSKWFVPYYFDVGTGDSKLTTTGYTGVGYGFDWGEVTLTYRYMYYDFDADQGATDMTFYGPAIGANFRF